MKQVAKMKNSVFPLVLFILLSSIDAISQKMPYKWENRNLTDSEINALIKKNSPINGAKIPVDLKYRLGATHVGGKYSLTQEPFLIEGCKAIENLGFGTIKLWFRNNPAAGYPYNSDWDLPQNATLTDIARHPYFKAVFNMPFKVFALSLGGKADLKKAFGDLSHDFSADRDEIYELAKYLLTAYKDREITFIFQNWEGDWLLRGGTGTSTHWKTDSYPQDVKKRCEVMIDWFKARQDGVNRARNEIINSKCKIYHAIEVNKVTDCQNGIPGLTSDVLPFVSTDLVSWSCYDGLKNPIALWRGIDYIKKNIKPTGVFPGVPVMIGEIGIPEQREPLATEEEIVNRWDSSMAVFFGQKIPYIFHWEVYCNEPKDDSKAKFFPMRTKDEMKGFWLIRPDGSESYCARFLEKLLKNAGERLTDY